MFNFNELKQIHLEITNRCQASCPMCSRNHYGGLENPLLKEVDWTIDDFKTIMTDEVLQQLESFYFCGNFGDPIINNDLIKMCKHSKEINPKLYIRIHTNGSARNIDWWKELATSLPSGHNVIFAIDGLEDTHSIYRIGTKYDKILENATAFISQGGKAEWCFIKFKHNEHQVEEAKRRAKELGFDRFTVKDSSRFVGKDQYPVLNQKGNIEYYLEPPTGTTIVALTPEIIKNYKALVADTEIDCYVNKTKEIYIDAYKTILPCCFLASAPYNYSPEGELLYEARKTILEQYTEVVDSLGGLEKINGLNSTVKDVINSQEWQSVWNEYWTTNKLITCARTCGVNPLSKPKDQFIEAKQL